jgi:hypothetical protein
LSTAAAPGIAGKALRPAVAIGRAFAGGHLVRRQAAVLPAVDMGGKLAGGPALFVDAFGLDELFQQADLVVGVEDGEVGLQAHQLGVAAQDFYADGVEGAKPGHALDHAADEPADALLHFARGLVGEGDGEDFARPRLALGEDVGKPGGEHAGLAGAGTCQHQQRAVERFNGGALFRVERAQVWRRSRCGGTRGDAGAGLGRCVGHGGYIAPARKDSRDSRQMNRSSSPRRVDLIARPARLPQYDWIN